MTTRMSWKRCSEGKIEACKNEIKVLLCVMVCLFCLLRDLFEDIIGFLFNVYFTEFNGFWLLYSITLLNDSIKIHSCIYLYDKKMVESYRKTMPKYQIHVPK